MSDPDLKVKRLLERDIWKDPDVRQNTRHGMRLQLFAALAEYGDPWMQDGLPVEARRYLPVGYFMPDATLPDVPAEQAESGDAPWETIELTLSMPVRQAAV